MESKRVQRLKLAMYPLAFTLFLSLFNTALLLAITPLIAMADGAHITLVDGGIPPCDIGCFVPDGESTPSDVIAATIFVGDVVRWDQGGVNHHSVTASTTEGDYQGHTCPEPGGLSALFVAHDDRYEHLFTTPGDCYYRSTFDPPNPGTGYPGMQGVIHVLPATGPSPVWLMPVNISTLPSVAQSFTAIYADPNGHSHISDTSLSLSGSTHKEVLHYNPLTDIFTLEGVAGDCSPGQAATLSNAYLTLNCSSSSASNSGDFLTVTYNLTPQPPLSGTAYLMIMGIVEMGGDNRNRTMGHWIVNRPPSAYRVSPMNSTTAVGTVQIFTAVYSDPDGWQNIAVANFYLSGNGGLHNEWLHYLAAPNLFTMMGTNDVCNPGQAKTLSNGFLTLNCGTSTISGSGTTLLVTYRVTPQPSSSGIQYNIFTAVSDQAGAYFAIFAGTWKIQ